MRRLAFIIGPLLLLLGVFWTGRESTHGLSAFGEHWWCPVPLVLIVIGLIAITLTRTIRDTTRVE